MSKLQLIDAKTTMEKLLLKLGFNKTIQKGSHDFFRHENGRTTTVPFHLNKDLARSLIRVIINEINLSVQEYNEIINNLGATIRGNLSIIRCHTSVNNALSYRHGTSS